MESKMNVGPFSKNRRDYVVKLIDPKITDRVLNIGISNIPEIEMSIENRVNECWTIDLDKNKIEEASKFLKKTNLVFGDISNCSSLKKGYFDKIVILEVLEHLDDDYKVVSILRDLLKKNGEIIASVPNRNPLHILNPVMYTQHKRHYSNKMFKELFVKNGFRVSHFNIVESWRLLFNLYRHLFFKFFLKKNKKFNYVNNKADLTYTKINKNGLDLVIKASKLPNVIEKSF